MLLFIYSQLNSKASKDLREYFLDGKATGSANTLLCVLAGSGNVVIRKTDRKDGIVLELIGYTIKLR